MNSKEQETFQISLKNKKSKSEFRCFSYRPRLYNISVECSISEKSLPCCKVFKYIFSLEMFLV